MSNISDIFRGALFMSISMAGFALNDAIIKLVSAELDLYQIIFLRGIFATLLVGMLVRRRGGLFYLPSRHDAGIMALRAVRASTPMRSGPSRRSVSSCCEISRPDACRPVSPQPMSRSALPS